MTIKLELSASGVMKALNEVLKAKDNLEYGIEQTTEILAKEGADRANKAYGNMAYASEFKDSSTQTSINVPGGDVAIIAEFGAGYATMEDHPFAKNAPVPVKVASYSEQNGPGLFYKTHQKNPGSGYWIFGGETYDRVLPRHGLLDAYEYIIQEGVNVAQGVIKL